MNLPNQKRYRSRDNDQSATLTFPQFEYDRFDS